MILVPLYACPVLQAQSHVDQALTAQLDALLANTGGKGAVFAGLAVELPSGRVLYDHDADRPMMPASVQKMAVIAGGIDRLGADFAFETILARRGNDLIVIGGGDPAFGDPRLAAERGTTITAVFKRWGETLQAAGLQNIRGRLLFDDSIFDAQHVHPNWPTGQHETWYEAPIGGLNLADNCVTVTAVRAATQKQASLAMVPGNTALNLINDTKPGKSNKLSAKRGPGSERIVVTGTMAGPGKIAELSVHDPGLYFATALRATLAGMGIHIEGATARQRVRQADGTLPRDLAILARERTPLRDAAARAGKQSLGMMAEGIIKRMGVAPGGGSGSWRTGAQAMERFMAQCGASAGQYRFDDGSGLSRENRLSPAAAVCVLRHMFTHRAKDTFMASLSHAGVDGTLERRLKDAKGRVIGKTGYISGVRTLAGYAQRPDGQWVAFAFFHNQAKNTSSISAAQDDACRALLGMPRPTTRGKQKRRV